LEEYKLALGEEEGNNEGLDLVEYSKLVLDDTPIFSISEDDMTYLK
jgi:hypothetical protein